MFIDSPTLPFSRWYSTQPLPQPVYAISEPPSAALMWRSLRVFTDVPERGTQLFSGTDEERRELWGEFRSFVRQAASYYSSAESVQGSSAALLYYYAFLNLAKAELLKTEPEFVRSDNVRHGLSYARESGHTVPTDLLSVPDGVFPRLYKKRTSTALSTDRLSVLALLERVPEIGWEIEEIELGASTSAFMFHVLALEAASMWSVMAVGHASSLLTNAPCADLLNQHYEQVSIGPANFRQIFSFTASSPTEFAFFQQRERRKASGSEGVTTSELIDAAEWVWNTLKPIIDYPYRPGEDAALSPSISNTDLVPMPPSLARYASMFYVSSLVRYQPSRLNPAENPKDAWLLDAFTDQAALPLLHSFLLGITGQTIIFSSGVGRD